MAVSISGPSTQISIEGSGEGSITLGDRPSIRILMGAQGPAGPAGDGDMNAATYDPTAISGDVFDLSNHHTGTVDNASVVIDGGLI